MIFCIWYEISKFLFDYRYLTFYKLAKCWAYTCTKWRVLAHLPEGESEMLKGKKQMIVFIYLSPVGYVHSLNLSDSWDLFWIFLGLYPTRNIWGLSWHFLGPLKVGAIWRLVGTFWTNSSYILVPLGILLVFSANFLVPSGFLAPSWNCSVPSSIFWYLLMPSGHI